MKNTLSLCLLFFFFASFPAQVPRLKIATETGDRIFKGDSLHQRNIIGKWKLVYFQSGIMETDSIEQHLAQLKKPGLKKTANAYTMVFSSDSVSLVPNSKIKYVIDPAKQVLIFIIPGTKSTLSQKIYKLTDRFLVVEDCTLDCFTLFYMKE